VFAPRLTDSAANLRTAFMQPIARAATSRGSRRRSRALRAL